MNNQRQLKIQRILEGEVQAGKYLFPLQRVIVQEGHEKNQSAESLGCDKWEVIIDC